MKFFFTRDAAAAAADELKLVASENETDEFLRMRIDEGSGCLSSVDQVTVD